MIDTAQAVVERVSIAPIEAGSDGVIRITGSRVTLDTIAEAFDEGLTAEEIVHQYPSLSLPDVYSVIGHILRRRDEVDAYLAQRKKQGAAIQKENESRFPPDGIRERLLARQKRSMK